MKFYTLSLCIVALCNISAACAIDNLGYFIDEDCPLLLQAIIKDDIEQVKSIINNSCTTEVKDHFCSLRSDGNGFTELHYTAELNRTCIMRYLLEEAGIRPDRPGPKYYPLPVIDQVRDQFILSHTKFHIQPLHTACKFGNRKAASLLLEKKADLNRQDGYGSTPLHLAAAFGHAALVKLLLEHKANPNISNNAHALPIYYACLSGNLESVAALLAHKGEINNYLMSLYNNSLIRAVTDGHTKITRLLLNALPQLNRSALFITACRKGHTKIVQLLLKTHSAHEYSESPLNAACYSGNFETVKFLVQAGADVNHVQSFPHTETPLFTACKYGHYALAEFLIISGANIDDHSSFNSIEIQSENKNSCVYLKTALDVACYHGHARIVELLLRKGTNPKWRKYERYGPLGLATLNGHTEVAALLLAYGTHIIAPDKYPTSKQYSPLEIAQAKGHNSIAELITLHLNRKSKVKRIRHAPSSSSLHIKEKIE